MTRGAAPGGQRWYRVEDGEPRVDVSVGALDEIFDNRDPAPFHGRDLDPALVEYLRDAAEDLAKGPYRVVFWVRTPCLPQEVERALRSHFGYLLQRIQRRRREQVRSGRGVLAVAFGLLVLLLLLSRFVSALIPGPLGVGLGEGLVVLSWVVLWRPIEVLVYDGIPVRRERRVIASLLSAPIEVRFADGPGGALHRGGADPASGPRAGAPARGPASDESGR